MTSEELIAECKRIFATGADKEALLEFLRESGCSKIDSIVVVMRTFEIDLAKAKETVHFSRTWHDTRKADESFHETLANAVTKGDVD